MDACPPKNRLNVDIENKVKLLHIYLNIRNVTSLTAIVICNANNKKYARRKICYQRGDAR